MLRSEVGDIQVPLGRIGGKALKVLFIYLIKQE